MRLVKALAHRLVGHYEIYRVLELTPAHLSSDATAPAGHRMRMLNEPEEFLASQDQDLCTLNHYAAPESKCFVVESENGLVGACWFWYGASYRRRNFWPLRDGEAKLVQVTIAASHRNRRMAQNLIRYASKEMFEAGFTRLFARVWHSHTASLGAFRRAGWRDVALVITVNPFGKVLRLCKPASGPLAFGYAAHDSRKTGTRQP